MRKEVILEWVKNIALALLIAIVINQLLLFVSYVPSTSMAPTIKPKDRLLIMRIYDTKDLKRGDIITFKRDADGEEVAFIKRLIGLPGDTVEVKEGKLYINNQKVNEPYVKFQDAISFNETVVPEGNYLFFGDNRQSSYDARYWPDMFVKREKIVGRATILLYPPKRMKIIKNPYD